MPSPFSGVVGDAAGLLLVASLVREAYANPDVLRTLPPIAAGRADWLRALLRAAFDGELCGALPPESQFLAQRLYASLMSAVEAPPPRRSSRPVGVWSDRD